MNLYENRGFSITLPTRYTFEARLAHFTSLWFPCHLLTLVFSRFVCQGLRQLIWMRCSSMTYGCGEFLDIENTDAAYCSLSCATLRHTSDRASCLIGTLTSFDVLYFVQEWGLWSLSQYIHALCATSFYFFFVSIAVFCEWRSTGLLI